MEIHSAWALVLVSLGAAFLPSLGSGSGCIGGAGILFGVVIGKSLLNLQFGKTGSLSVHLGF